MEVDWTLVASYASPLVALFVGAGIGRFLESRPKLVTYLAHAAAIRVPQPEGHPVQVHTHSVVVRNAGRKAATHVRLGHNVLPAFSVYPSCEYNVLDVPAGGREIVFPTLVPKEQVTVAYLYFPPCVWDDVNTYTKSDEGFARVLHALPTPQPPRWVLRLVWFFIIIGSVTTLLVLVQFLVRLFRLVYSG